MALWKECLQAICCQSLILEVAQNLRGRRCFFEGSHFGIMLRKIGRIGPFEELSAVLNFALTCQLQVARCFN